MSEMIIELPRKLRRRLLAVGGDLKCNPVLAEGDRAILLDDVGDLASPEGQDALEEMLAGQGPDALVCDRHPGYFTSSLARRLSAEGGLPLLEVQHHRAHVAAVCAEYGLFTEPVVGLAFDGTGYGDDGTVWGGEIFTGSLAGSFVRRAHFATLPLPGGDAAVRRPWRIALALLLERCADPSFAERWLAQRRVPLDDPAVFRRALSSGVAIGRSSALGRWFDAVAALLGVRIEADFEAQPAIILQQLAEEHFSYQARGLWEYEIRQGDPSVIDFPQPEKAAEAEPDQVPQMAAAFHFAAADAVSKAAGKLAAEADTKTVVASGGCFLNRLFTRLLDERLADDGLRLKLPERLPPGDQALAVGQIALAMQEPVA